MGVPQLGLDAPKWASPPVSKMKFCSFGITYIDLYEGLHSMVGVLSVNIEVCRPSLRAAAFCNAKTSPLGTMASGIRLPHGG